ncbi:MULTISPECIES: SRPBCC family protein [unclassified Devosia]|uniref:SRPBCC family protein n=1 Tax=unclassified Devosia TaxID=196773 RepID=UPI0025DCA339|nr:SRPBCC domain-containing protein [Devosia sp.]MCR6637358.1 SRPBCC domain-containing protein [Devosia sp.]
MAEATPEIRTVVIERDFSHRPEKLWRALTQPHLIKEWLMSSDFAPDLGHKFKFTADWGAIDCEVKEIEPNRTLAYSWDAYGLESTVTWTLTPIASGTQLRMEQTGFRPDQNQAYHGARMGWQDYFGKLEDALGRME